MQQYLLMYFIIIYSISLIEAQLLITSNKPLQRKIDELSVENDNLDSENDKILQENVCLQKGTQYCTWCIQWNLSLKGIFA